jgi:phosphate transport system substrate-binding protein
MELTYFLNKIRLSQTINLQGSLQSMKKISTYSFLLGSLWALASLGIASAQSIKGAGSSAAAPIYQSWAAEYQKLGQSNLAYESIGSSAGLKKIKENGVDFGASDVVPSTAELTKSQLVAFPIAITGVVPVLNLPSLGTRTMRLNGAVLADIYLGSIEHWNDPRIKSLNPDIRLPDTRIKVVVRSDGSGTTYNFADYLAKISPSWSAKYGVKTGFNWPQSFVGAKGSEGMAEAVKSTVGSIGYVDFGYVEMNGLKAIQLQNSSGAFVSPSSQGFKDALANSDWYEKDNFSTTLTNKAGEGSWPITMGTFAIFPKVTHRPRETSRALEFFVWAFMSGDKLVQKSNFVRLPDRIQARAYKAITSIKDTNGAALRVNMISYTVAQK